MKTKKTLRNLSLIFIVTSLVSCVGGKGGDKKEAGPRPNSNPNALVIPVGVVDSGVATKTFNQYNITLSKLTGIETSDPAVNSEYLAIRNSLPAGHETSSFTPFHQVAVTRLSFAYCDAFIDNDTQFDGLDYANLTGSQISTLLVNKFVGDRTSENAVMYDAIQSEISAIMNNDAGLDDMGNAIGDLVPNGTGAGQKRNLTKLGCTALLASAEFSVL